MYVHVWSAHLLHRVAAKSGLHLLHPPRQHAQQKRPTTQYFDSFGRCVPCRQHSLRCYSHLCTRHVLHVFSSHHEDVCLARRFHIAEYTLTHMRTICCTLTQHSRLSHFSFVLHLSQVVPACMQLLDHRHHRVFPSPLVGLHPTHTFLSKARNCLCTCGHSLTPLPSLIYCLW